MGRPATPNPPPPIAPLPWSVGPESRSAGERFADTSRRYRHHARGENRKTDAVRVLVEAGANVNAQEKWAARTLMGGGRGTRRGRPAADRGRRGRQRSVVLRRRCQRPRLRGAHSGRAAAGGKNGGVRQRLADAADVRRARRRPGAGPHPGRCRRRRRRGRRRREDGAGAGDLQRQLRRDRSSSTATRTSTKRTRSGLRRCSGGRSAQHGDGAELPVDGDEGSAAHPPAARRRRQSERAHQQHAARPHARRLAAHRLRDRADAGGLRRGSRAGPVAPRARRRPEDRVAGPRDDGVGGRGLAFIHGYHRGSHQRNACRSSSGSSSWATTSISRTTTASPC